MRKQDDACYMDDVLFVGCCYESFDNVCVRAWMMLLAVTLLMMLAL